MKMNPRAKELWVEALRSGKYRQTQGWLHRSKGGYCCLGVLCDVAVKNGLDIPVKSDQEFKGGPFYTYYDTEGVELPEAVQKWAGLTYQGDSDYPPDPTVGGSTLSSWNDTEGATLVQIADLIEEHL